MASDDAHLLLCSLDRQEETPAYTANDEQTQEEEQEERSIWRQREALGVRDRVRLTKGWRKRRTLLTLAWRRRSARHELSSFAESERTKSNRIRLEPIGKHGSMGHTGTRATR